MAKKTKPKETVKKISKAKKELLKLKNSEDFKKAKNNYYYLRKKHKEIELKKNFYKDFNANKKIIFEGRKRKIKTILDILENKKTKLNTKHKDNLYWLWQKKFKPKGQKTKIVSNREKKENIKGVKISDEYSPWQKPLLVDWLKKFYKGFDLEFKILELNTIILTSKDTVRAELFNQRESCNLVVTYNNYKNDKK